MADSTVFVISHPEVVIDPDVPVPQWGLSEIGFARMTAFATSGLLDRVGFVASSAEQKAVDGASVIAAHRGLEPLTLAGLGENDRSSTGFLEHAEFFQMRDAFFGSPEESIRGWERAIDAQTRMRNAVDEVLAAATTGAGDVGGRDVAIVAHGGVGTLLLCALAQHPIDVTFDQPGQGHWYAFDFATRALLVDRWRPLESATI